jgi:uncharacterized protein YkwD
VTALVRLALCATIITAPVAADDPKPADKLKLSDDEQAILDLTNQERKTAGVPALKSSPVLMKLAREHSATMARLMQAGHDLDDKTFNDRLKEAKVAYRGAGENVGYGYPTPKAAVEGWMSSGPHKENLLSKEFTETGVAVAKSADGTLYWTQVCAVPAM